MSLETRISVEYMEAHNAHEGMNIFHYYVPTADNTICVTLCELFEAIDGMIAACECDNVDMFIEHNHNWSFAYNDIRAMADAIDELYKAAVVYHEVMCTLDSARLLEKATNNCHDIAATLWAMDEYRHEAFVAAEAWA